MEFLTMICSFVLFVSSFGFIGPEKPRWGNGQLKIFLFLYLIRVLEPLIIIIIIIILLTPHGGV